MHLTDNKWQKLSVSFSTSIVSLNAIKWKWSFSSQWQCLISFQVSGAAVAHVVYGNPGLKCLRVKGCRNLCQRESNTGEGEISSYFCGELEMALGKTCRLEELSVGWGFSHFSIEALKAAITSLREITVSLGGSLGEGALIQLPTACPSLESIVLQFQVLLINNV